MYICRLALSEEACYHMCTRPQMRKSVSKCDKSTRKSNFQLDTFTRNCLCLYLIKITRLFSCYLSYYFSHIYKYHLAKKIIKTLQYENERSLAWNTKFLVIFTALIKLKSTAFIENHTYSHMKH